MADREGLDGRGVFRMNHGTYAGWQAHIRHHTPICDPCKQARRDYQRERDHDQAAGNPRRIDPTPVREHVTHLVNNGMTTNLISQRSGVHTHTIRAIRHNVRPTISADHAAWILAVALQRDPNGLVPALGSMRRIRALAWLGWSADAVAQVANALGYDIKASSLKAIRSNRKATVRTYMHDALAAAYDELSMRPAPAGRGVNSLRTRARNAGWVPPLAWDCIDDPAEQPTGWRYVPSDRATLIQEMADRGDNRTQVERALGLSTNTLHSWLLNHDMGDVYRLLASREGDWNARGRYGRKERAA